MKKTALIFAASILASANVSATYNKDSDNLVLKFRGLFNTVSAKQTGLPAPYSNLSKTNPQSVGKLYSMGYGGEASISVFFNEFFATEFTSGLSLYKSKGTAIKALELNYSNTQSNKKKKNLYTIPSSLTLQYHIAPFGALRPYIGGGYHYTYMMPKAEQYKIKNSSGPVLQAGLDFVFTDETYLNLDVKQYFLKTKAKYSRSFITDASGNPISGKIKLDPISLGLGLGFKL